MAIIPIGSKGKVNGSYVNVRTDAGTQYPRVYYAQTGNIVVVQSHKTGTDGMIWLKIKNETSNTSLVGYIRNDFVDPYNGSGGGTWVIRWTNTPGETVNVRSGPGYNYGIVRTFSHGTKIEVNTPNATWSQVRLHNTTLVIGYIMTNYLTTSDPLGGGTPGVLTAGLINAVQTAVRSTPSTSPSTNLIGRYPKNAPVGFREVSGLGWHQVYYGYSPTLLGYTMENLITRQSFSINTLLAKIAEFWYTLGYTQSQFGMGGPNEQWCQWFVNWCVGQAGLGPDNPWVTNTNCTGGWNALKGSASSIPTEGSIFYTKKGTDTVSHTGIVVKRLSNTQCYVVEGNYNGSTSLNRRLFDVNNMPAGITFLGFVKPHGM